MKREIEEYPPPPILSAQAIELLTHLCFRKDDQEIPSVDCIFVFGSTISLDTLADKLNHLMQRKISKKIILTGGHVSYQGSKDYNISQTKMIYQRIQSFLSLDLEVLLEENSQNTLENVDFGLKLLPSPISSLCFITKNFHAARSYLSLRRYLKNISLFQSTYPPVYSDIDLKIQPQNWHQHPLGRARIWGEFLRIKKYGERNDISLAEVKELILQIDQMV